MKKINRKALGKFLLRLCLIALFLPILTLGLNQALKTLAAAPRFNFMGEANGDREMLTLSNTGRADSWTDPVNAGPGEEVFMSIYYHNGGDAVATNTIVKAYLPSQFGSTLVTRSGVKSDQTAEVFETTQTGSSAVYGRPDGTINVTGGVASKLDLVSGSVKWWIRDTSQTGWPLVQVPLPSGQNGDNLVAQGLNLGAVNFCWQYAGFITFKVKLTGGAPSGVANKRVALAGTDTWLTEITTQPGNLVQYLVHYNNTGTGTATGVKITDNLDSKLTYVPGFASWLWKDAQNNDHQDPVLPSEVLVEGQKVTFSYPRDVINNDNGSFFLQFRVKIADSGQFPPDSTTHIPNVAQITSTNGVNINTDQALIHVINPPTPTIVFDVDKTADNASQAGGTWLDFTTAGPGDTMSFKIDVINSGSSEAQNVVVKDTLPAEMTYLAGTTKLHTIDNLNGSPIADGIVGNGVTIASIPATVQISVTFQAKIKIDMPSGVTRLINTGLVPAGSWNSIAWIQASDTTTVDVSATRSLIVDKRVWNGTVYTDQDVRYEEGDTVFYQIVVSNNGNSTATNILVKDVLPPFSEYVFNSTRVDGVQVVDSGNAHIAGTGLQISNLAPAVQKIITFEARIKDCPELGDLRLVNTANVSADTIAQISDSVAILVLVDAPPLPNF